MKRVLLLDRWAEELRPLLKAGAPHLEFISREDLHSDYRDIWLGGPDQVVPLLKAGFLPSWLQLTWAGYQPLLANDLPRNYHLSRAVGVCGQPIAEYVLAHILAHEQQVFRRRKMQADHKWDEDVPSTLRGRRMLIVGAGDIGCEVALQVKPFGIRLDGVVSRPRTLEPFDRVVGMAELNTIAGDADYVVNLLPDSPATENVFDSDFFNALSPKAIFINVGRGSAVVDEALVQALERGSLQAAVLDVFREEPLKSNHPFWDNPKVTVTAHIAGPLIPELMCKLFLDNLARREKGGFLLGEVNLPTK